jgi:hypothetical protein
LGRRPGPTRRAALTGLATLALPLHARAADTRPFRLGTTRWPPEATAEGLALVDRFLRTHCDLSAPMVLGGVPWGIPPDAYSPALRAELDWAPPPGHRTCLSLGPLNTLRDGLAPLYAARDNQPLPLDWATRPFDDPAVITSYGDFCVEAARTMRPDWLVPLVEANILLHKRPNLWPSLVALIRATRERLAREVPGQKVAISATMTHYFGLADGADPAQQARGMADLMPFCDLLGWSVYPHTSWDIPQPVPADFYDRLSQVGTALGKPVAVTESGQTSRTVWIGLLPLRGSDERQVAHIEALLGTAHRGGWPFVVNWTSHDYPRLLDLFPPEMREIGEIWVRTGLADETGAPKPALGPWDQALARPLAPGR